MGYMIEEDGRGNIVLTITAMESFAVAALNGRITLTGAKDAFMGIGELLRGELGDDE